MRCRNSMQRSKSRNQRKRMKDTALALVTIVLCVVVAVMMFKAWVNEPTISEAEHKAYIASLQGGDK